MSWKPNLSDVEESKAKGYLLKKATEEAIFKFMLRFRGYKTDSTGRIYCAFLEDSSIDPKPNKYILVAKSYIYGDIVSCHLRAVIMAMNTNAKLIMYIDKGNNFYEFDPDEIMKEGNHELNERVGEKMANFKVKLGKRFSGG